MKPIIIDTPKGKEIIIREDIDVKTLTNILPEAFSNITASLFTINKGYVILEESLYHIKTHNPYNNTYSCIIELGHCLAWLGENKETNMYFYSIINTSNLFPQSWKKIHDPFAHFNVLGHFDHDKGDRLCLLCIDTNMKNLETASNFIVDLRESAAGKFIFVPL